MLPTTATLVSRSQDSLYTTQSGLCNILTNNTVATAPSLRRTPVHTSSNAAGSGRALLRTCTWWHVGCCHCQCQCQCSQVQQVHLGTVTPVAVNFTTPPYALYTTSRQQHRQHPALIVLKSMQGQCHTASDLLPLSNLQSSCDWARQTFSKNVLTSRGSPIQTQTQFTSHPANTHNILCIRGRFCTQSIDQQH